MDKQPDDTFDDVVKLEMKLRADAAEGRRWARTVVLCVMMMSASATTCQYAPSPACSCHNKD